MCEDSGRQSNNGTELITEEYEPLKRIRPLVPKQQVFAVIEQSNNGTQGKRPFEALSREFNQFGKKASKQDALEHNWRENDTF